MTTIGTTVSSMPGVVVIFINLDPPTTISGRLLSQKDPLTPIPKGNSSNTGDSMTDDGDVIFGSS